MTFGEIGDDCSDDCEPLDADEVRKEEAVLSIQGADAAVSMDGDSQMDPVMACVFNSFERMFRDAEDLSHYTGDYSTKWSENVGSLIPHLIHGVETLRPLGHVEQSKNQEESPEDPHVFKSYSKGQGRAREAYAI